MYIYNNAKGKMYLHIENVTGIAIYSQQHIYTDRNRKCQLVQNREL